MEEVDRWALAELDSVIERVTAGYKAFEFHAAYQTLYQFCTVTLSARYFDIIKDRLYTFGPRAAPRRSAQTALYEIADALARLFAPILVFTADEIWENLPASRRGDEGAALPSVHLAEFPLTMPRRDTALLERWARVFEVRDIVMRALEEARVSKLIGSSLEAHVQLQADRRLSSCSKRGATAPHLSSRRSARARGQRRPGEIAGARRERAVKRATV